MDTSTDITPIKILFLIPSLMNGGAERVLVNLVNNINKNNFEVSVKTVMNTGRYINCLDKSIHYSYIYPNLRHATSLYFKWFFSPQRSFQKYIGNDYDIVISFLEGFTNRIISGCTETRTKKIAWIHTVLENKKMFSHGFRSFKEAIMCYKSFDKICCVSNNVREAFIKTSGLSQDIEVVYNTNNTVDICERAKEPIDDIHFDNNIVNICSVGKIAETKGYDRLARIHKRLLDDGIKNHIYIIGTGAGRSKIEKYLTDNNIQKSFTFLGYRDNPYKYIARSDLYVCSSRREGFSTSVTEALILGLPIVTTNCSGAKEQMGENNEYGIVTENNEYALYEGIKKMLSTDGLLGHYKKQAQKRGSFFSTETTVQAVENLLTSLIKEKCGN